MACWDRATIPACPHTSLVTACPVSPPRCLSPVHPGVSPVNSRSLRPTTVHRGDFPPSLHGHSGRTEHRGHDEPGAGGTGEGVNGGGGGGGGDRRHGRPSPRAAEGADRRQRLTSPARGEAAPVAAEIPPPSPPSPPGRMRPPRRRDPGTPGRGDAEPALIAARCFPACANESDKSAVSAPGACGGTRGTLRAPGSPGAWSSWLGVSGPVCCPRPAGTVRHGTGCGDSMAQGTAQLQGTRMTPRAGLGLAQGKLRHEGTAGIYPPPCKQL